MSVRCEVCCRTYFIKEGKEHIGVAVARVDDDYSRCRKPRADMVAGAVHLKRIGEDSWVG